MARQTPHIFILTIMSCFIVTTACQIVHLESHTVVLSPFQKAIEKYEKFGHIVQVVKNAQFSSFVYQQFILPHTLCFLILLQNQKLDGIFLQRSLQALYEKKIFFVFRLPILYMPSLISIHCLYSVMIISFFLSLSLYGYVWQG